MGDREEYFKTSRPEYSKNGSDTKWIEKVNGVRRGVEVVFRKVKGKLEIGVIRKGSSNGGNVEQ